MELLISVAIVGILASIAIPALQRAVSRARHNALMADGKTLHAAFMKFHIDNGLFPSTTTPVSRVFDLTTLAPLSTNGYIGQPQALTGKLLGGKVTAYDSPDINGSDTQFWAVLTNKTDPSIAILVASTNQYPGFTGIQYDGAYDLP